MITTLFILWLLEVFFLLYFCDASCRHPIGSSYWSWVSKNIIYDSERVIDIAPLPAILEKTLSTSLMVARADVEVTS